MEKNTIVNLIVDSLREILLNTDGIDASKLPVLDESTPLIGHRAILESIGLVSLIVDIEDKLDEDHDISLTIADERAMSQEKSPFRTVGLLSGYIYTLIKEYA